MSQINKRGPIPQPDNTTMPTSTTISPSTKMSNPTALHQIPRRVALRRVPRMAEGELRRRFCEGENGGIPNMLNERVMSGALSPILLSSPSSTSSANLEPRAVNRSPTPVQRIPTRRPSPADAQTTLTRGTSLYPPESRTDQARVLDAARAVERRDSERTTKSVKRSLASALGEQAIDKAKALKDCVKTVLTAAFGRLASPVGSELEAPSGESQPVEQTVSLPGSFPPPAQSDAIVYALHNVELHNPAMGAASGLEPDPQASGDIDPYLNDPRRQDTVRGTQSQNSSPRRRIHREIVMRERAPPTRAERRHRAFKAMDPMLTPIVDVGTPPTGSCSTSSIPSLASPLPSPMYDIPDQSDVDTTREGMFNQDERAPRLGVGALKNNDGPRDLDHLARNRDAVTSQQQQALAASEPDHWTDRGSRLLTARILHATRGILTPTGVLMGLHREEVSHEERKERGVVNKDC